MTSPTVAPAATRSRLGWAIAIASAACFSAATPAARGAILLGINPTTLVMLRLTTTTLLLFGTILLTEPARLRLEHTGLRWCLIAGLANGIGMLAYFWSLTRISGSIASMIFSLSPLVVLSLLALRGEKFTFRNTVRLALGLGGVYLLIGPGGHVDLLGALLAVVAVFAAPCQLVILQWFLQSHHMRTVTLYTVGTMAVVAAGWWLVSRAGWQNPGWRGWALIFLLAFVSTYLARILTFMAVRRIGSGQVGLLEPVDTLLTVVWSFLFLGERLTAMQSVGGALILLSAGLAIQRLGRVEWRRIIS